MIRNAVQVSNEAKLQTAQLLLWRAVIGLQWMLDWGSERLRLACTDARMTNVNAIIVPIMIN